MFQFNYRKDCNNGAEVCPAKLDEGLEFQGVKIAKGTVIRNWFTDTISSFSS